MDYGAITRRRESGFSTSSHLLRRTGVSGFLRFGLPVSLTTIFLNLISERALKNARVFGSSKFVLAVLVFVAATFFSASSYALQIGDRVQANGTVNVRSTAAGTILGSQASGNQGTIIGGPQTASLSGTSYTWWNVNWDTGVDGWVADIGLTLTIPVTPTGTSPGSITSPGPTQSSTSVPLSWSASSGATYYDLGVRDMVTNTLVVSTTVTGTSYTANLSAGGQYRWNVSACNGTGCSSFTTPLYFQTPIAVVTPSVNSVSPNPVTGSNSSQSFTIYGSGFGSSSTVTLRDLSTGEVFPNRAISSLSSTQITINPIFTTAAATWSVEVINNGTGSSGQFNFQVVAPVSSPSISSVSPNPVPGSSSPQNFIINGSNFVSGLTVRLRDLTNGGTFDKTPISFSSNQVTISANFTTAAANWTVQIINPDGGTSSQLSFSVTAPSESPPTTPSLLSPANGTSFAAGTASVTLQWSAPTGATGYNVEVSTGGCGLTPFNGFMTAQNSWSVAGLANGQTYYWRVQAVYSGGTSAYSGCNSFTVKISRSEFGLTILTHGYRSGSEGWLSDMASAIRARVGGSVHTLTLTTPYPGGEIQSQLDQPIDLSNSGSAIVMLDWKDLDEGTCTGGGLLNVATQDVADRVFNALFAENNPDGLLHGLLGTVPIHLIGHSRGASLMSRVAWNLGQHGIWVDHYTALDAHPLSFGCSESDFAVASWNNVIYADSYLRRDGIAPQGNSVPGAYEVDLTGIINGDGLNWMCPGFLSDGTAHEQVHTFYHGTIDTSAVCVDGSAIQSRWYTEKGTSRETTGFVFNWPNKTVRPTSGLHQNFTPGTGLREPPAQLIGPAWPNVYVLPPETGYTFRVGETIAIPFYYQDRGASLDIFFRLDDDTNPFNVTGSSCDKAFGNQLGLIGGNTISLGEHPRVARSTDVGTCYLRAEARDAGGRVRYDYLSKPITILEEPVPTLSAPQTLSPGSVTDTGFTVSGLTPTFSWNAVPGADSYGLYISKEPYGSANLVFSSTSLTGTSFTIPNGYLVSGTKYRWQMTSVASGIESASASALLYFKTPVIISYNITTGTSLLAGGSTSGGGTYTSGSSVTVVAAPNSGYSFVNWTENGSVVSSSANYTFTASANRTLVAVFAPIPVNTYTLNVTATNGTVTKNPDQASYSAGSQVILTAVPASGYAFSNWGGDAGGSTNPLTITMDGNKNITANFTSVAQQTGSIRVSIVPQAAADAGAQWRIVGESTWRGSGTIASGLAFGSYNVEFSTIPGWTTPANQVVPISLVIPDIWVDSGSYVQTVTINAPSNLQATADANGGVVLTWADNSNNEIGFKLEQKFGTATTFSHKFNLDPNTTSFTDTFTSLGVVFCYRISAIDLYGALSGYSNVSCAMPQVTDTTPDPFSFAAQTNVALGSVAQSNPITVSGINAPASISITGGQYSIDGGTYTAGAGTVTNGQTVTVRQTSASTRGTTTTAVLTIGGVSGSFYVTTLPPCLGDSDCDGMSDIWELANGLNPYVNDTGDDLDGDGIINYLEYLAGTNPADNTNKPPRVNGIDYVLFRDHFDNGRYDDRWYVSFAGVDAIYALNESGTALTATMQRPISSCVGLMLDVFGNIDAVNAVYNAQIRLDGHGATGVGLMKGVDWNNRIEVQIDGDSSPYLRLRSWDSGVLTEGDALLPTPYQAQDLSIRLVKRGAWFAVFVNNKLQRSITNNGLSHLQLRPYLALESCPDDGGPVDSKFDLVEILLDRDGDGLADVREDKNLNGVLDSGETDPSNPESDGDGVQDGFDNCTLKSNANARDTDGDGFGNVCDPDLNNDGVVNDTDLAIMKSRFYTNNPDADLNGDGYVNVGDMAILKSLYGKPPGPSGLVP